MARLIPLFLYLYAQGLGVQVKVTRFVTQETILTNYGTYGRGSLRNTPPQSELGAAPM